ncbi:hypothetical protein UFOVP461_9 [uncultured Caudovirales phage]|uniref:Uncharacterized protein n=1 Tax=uncultured Caudovirales phage TaxID=2100421 RepID=A0A6J5MKJ2_9CAUD|nr:hypothetical protein UFOVP461_9 [uncultured Caudovirales phage]CAB4189312.1 hypothetical protein UFOVP1185_31 [uncultured Caudovirales phage]
MQQVGSDRGMSSNSIAGLNDANGESIVSTSNEFAASPLGIAARTQSLYGIPNSNFTLLPPDPATRLLDGENPLPYWSVLEDSDGRITAKSTFNTTTSTWGVVLDPSAGTAISTDTLTMKTRSYVITDDNLSVRQKAFLSLSKSGTAGGTASQWNVKMTAEYFDATGTSLSGGTPYTIGTALDTATFTTINGFTTTGGSAIGASAQYVDISVIVTATATVTGSAKATITSLLIQTSTGAASAQSFIVTETFTSSTTWTRPTGVNYLLGAFVAGAGGGGGGGQANGGASTTGTVYSNGGGGGGAGGYAFAQNIYCGSAATLSVTVGAGGAGGVGGTSNNNGASNNGTDGAAGGATTLSGFSVYGTGSLSATGGGGGAGTPAGVGAIFAGGTAGAGTLTYISSIAGTTGGASGGNGADGRTPTVGVNASGDPFTQLPLLAPTLTVGNAGGSGTATSGAVGAGGALGTAIPWRGLSPSGSGGGGANVIATVQSASAGGSAPTLFGTAFAGPSGLGGGGAARYWTVAGTVLVRGGAGGDGSAFGAGGGGGGGAARVANNGTTRNASSGNAIGGAGGSGANGIVVIWYVG